jgi:hypothetical protein
MPPSRVNWRETPGYHPIGASDDDHIVESS